MTLIEIIISSSVLIIAIILLRFFLRGKIKNRIVYSLWLIVAIRLLIPFGLPESPLSIMNLQKYNTAFMTSISNMDDVQIQHSTNSNNITKESDKEIIHDESNNIDKNHAAYSNHEYENMQQVKESNLHGKSFHWYKWIMIIWIIGMFSLFFWFLTVNCIFYLRLRRYRVKATIKCTLPVYIIKDLGSPCIFGIRKPAIYLNEAAVKKKDYLNYIIAHELCHYRHGDLLWSILRCFLVSVYWFHPLVWLAAYLSKQDCECACDESVMKNFSHKQRIEYGKTLLLLVSTSRTSIIGTVSTSMTSKGNCLKERLMFITQKTKTSIPAMVILISVLFIITGCTFTSSSQNNLKSKMESQSYFENDKSERLEDVRAPTETTLKPDQTDIVVTTLKDSNVNQTVSTSITTVTEEVTTEVSQTTNKITSDDNDEKTMWENYARQRFENAWYIYFHAITNGTYYETDYSTAYDERGNICNEVSDYRVSTVSDVKADLKNIFSESFVSQHDNWLNNVYKEIDGKLYQIPRGKGGVFSMENIEIELISNDSNRMEFNASLYHDNVYLGIQPFTLVYENDDWKVDEFTEPELYSAPEMYKSYY